MPEQGINPQVFISPTSPNPRKWLFIYLTVGLLIIVIAVLGMYYFYLKERSTDILTLPGWSKYQDIQILDDNSFQIFVASSSSELIISNTSDKMELGNREFEILVKMKTVSNKDPKSQRSSSFIIYKEIDGKEKPLQLQIGLDPDNYPFLAYIDLNLTNVHERRKYIVTSKNSSKNSSDQLKIRVYKDETNSKVEFYDAVTNTILAKDINLPIKLLTDASTGVYFGLYPQAQDYNGATMLVDYFKLIKK